MIEKTKGHSVKNCEKIPFLSMARNNLGAWKWIEEISSFAKTVFAF
jgi:hypothetical protein